MKRKERLLSQLIKIAQRYDEKHQGLFDWEQHAITEAARWLKDLSLPPAEGAEDIRQLLLGWEKYKRDHFRESEALDVEAILMSEYSQIVAQQPKLDPKKVQWSGYGPLGNISQKPLQQHPTAEGADKFRSVLNEIQSLIETMDGATDCQLKVIWNHLSDAITASEKPQPTAEGAEEILTRRWTEVYPNQPFGYGGSAFKSQHSKWVVKAMTDFATLHAQRIAEKMVKDMNRGWPDLDDDDRDTDDD